MHAFSLLGGSLETLDREMEGNAMPSAEVGGIPGDLPIGVSEESRDG